MQTAQVEIHTKIGHHNRRIGQHRKNVKRPAPPKPGNQACVNNKRINHNAD